MGERREWLESVFPDTFFAADADVGEEYRMRKEDILSFFLSTKEERGNESLFYTRLLRSILSAVELGTQL